MSHNLRVVDVFGSGPFTGNPLAVIAAADRLDTDAMQRITRWLNFSETAFLLPPTNPHADYRVRIFTLARELPFAGHPTLGTCHAWLELGGRPRSEEAVVQECGIGLVKVRRYDENLAFPAPALLRRGTPTEAELAQALGVLRLSQSDVVEARWIDNGPGWLGIMLHSAQAVLRLDPVRTHHGRIDIGVVGPYDPGGEAQYELRAFFSDDLGGIVEDPVTGSLNAAVGQWLFDSGRAKVRYVAGQGKRLGRAGRVEVSQAYEGQVWVGGRTVTMIEGCVSV